MTNNDNLDSQSDPEPLSQIIILGILVLVTILAPALLHTNQYEFLIERFELNLLKASYFDTALYTSYLIAGILTAIIANQIGKRKIFILLGSSGSSVFYLAMTTTLNFPLLLIFRFLQGSFTVLCWQILMTIVLDLSTAQNRGRNLGIFGMFLALAMGSGPVLGGILAGLGVLVPYYAASLLSFFVFLLALVFLKEPRQLIPKPSFLKNVGIVFRKPRLIIPAIFNFVDRFHIGFILFILPLFLPIVLQVEPELRGMVLGLFALPFIILQYPVGKWSDKIGRYKPLIIGSITVGVMLTIMGYLGSFGLFAVIIGFIILGIGNGFTGPTAMALVGDTVEADDNAVGMGFFNLLGNIGIVMGPFIGGFLAYSETQTAFVTAFVVAGLIEFISLTGVILLILFVFKRNKG
ncbi:MAG: MFS transporter [Candidatus Heimdallarchaeota archaeon]|nr:MAG: MFS transporter [Candidatus Heimdallarchaeota archaeon]